MDASLNHAYTMVFPILAGPYESRGELRRMKRILVADPDVARSAVLQWLLEAEGHQVQKAHSYWTVLEEAGFGGYDLTIVSHQETRFNALRLIAGLTKLKPGMPVILIHSDQTGEVSRQASRLGVWDCYGKPIDYERIQKYVRGLPEQ